MIVEDEDIVKKLMKARTFSERKSVLMQLHMRKAVGKSGDELLRHHLSQMEIFLSHLFVISHMSIKAESLKRLNTLPLLEIGMETIDGMIGEDETVKCNIITPLWPPIRKLYCGILGYEGGDEPYFRRMRLSYRAAKILLNFWTLSMGSDPGSSLYHSEMEEDFAMGLPFPFSWQMPMGEQISALMKNIERILEDD